MVEAESKQAYKIKEGITLWFTGLSGAGKTTLSAAVKERLDAMLGDAQKCFLLDGDVIRTGLNKDLGFSAEDRCENIRRISEVSKLFNIAGQVSITAFISPYAKDRAFARKCHVDAGRKYLECHISAPLDVCEQRDVKGLYKKARAGEIKHFTGISDPYEAPEEPEMNIPTHSLDLQQCVTMVIQRLIKEGALVNLNESVIAPSLIKETTEDLTALKTLNIDLETCQYLQVLAEGWANPLDKFMDEMQLLEVIQMKTITDKVGKRHLFSVPITCPAKTEEMEALKGEAKIALVCPEVSKDVLAVINKPTFYANRKEEISARTFGTFSTKHPKIENIMAQGDWNVTGETMDFVKRIRYNDGLDEYRLTPQEIKDQATAKGADAVYGFQVRNPLHNGHCLLLLDTRDKLLAMGYKNPVLLLHPLGGWCKDDDVPTLDRMKQHQALLDDGTLPKEHTILAIWPSPMYYAGPTEVAWHASSRAGCGITHFITGRDPAGVKHPEDPKADLYDVWHGQKLLVHIKSMINNVEIMPFKVAALNTKTSKMEFFDPKASNAADFEFISGSRMRAMAKNDEQPPAGFMSPAGWEVLKTYYKSLKE